MYGITNLEGVIAQLFNDLVIAQVKDGVIKLSTHGTKDEGMRRYMNKFAAYLDLPFYVYSDWVVTYKGIATDFVDGMELESK